MEYSIDKLARISGVSVRTLRHYDQIGLLRPKRKSNGYRVYGAAEVERLQQVLFYRELGVELNEIALILDAPGFDVRAAMRSHREGLRRQQMRLDRLLANVETTIMNMEGAREMADKERFEGFGDRLVLENERTHGAEARAKYGDAAVDASNAKVRGMTKEQWDGINEEAAQANAQLALAMDTGDPAGEAALKAAAMHRAWLSHFGDYSDEAHEGLGEMYVADERFKAHYDAVRPGAAEFLRDAIKAYVKRNRG